MEEIGDQSLSVAIVCYHTPLPELIALLSSLLAAIETLRPSNSSIPVQIHLIDNTESPSVTFSDFHSLQKRLDLQDVEMRITHGHGNVGYGAGHNLALNKADSRFHLILNPDVVMQNDSLEAGINYLLKHEKTVLVSPRAIDSKGNKQYLCKQYPSVLTFLMRGFFPNFMKNLFHKKLSKFEMQELSESEPSSNIPIVSGCFMLWKTAALKQLQGFDENYFLYFEDFDLSLRAASIGQVDYLPSMVIEHSGGNAAKKGLSHLKMFTRSGIRFFNTHGWRIF